MAKELSSQNDPLDANLEKVLPSLHEWHRINKDEMARLKQSFSTMDCKMSDICNKVDNGFEQLTATLMSNKKQTKQEMAGTFLEIAKYLVKDGHQVSDTTTLADIVGPCTMTLDEPVGSPNPAQDTFEASPNAESATGDYLLFRMKPKHVSLLDLVHEWFGTGDYYDGYGGIHGRNSNKSLLKDWMKVCCINQMQYSRTKRTVEAVSEYARLNNIDVYQSAERLQLSYTACKHSVANFVNWAQGDEVNLLAKKKARGRAKRRGDNGETMALE
jgi:hypothetical protein